MIKTPVTYGMIAGFTVALYVYLLDYTEAIYKGPYGIYLGYLAIVIMPVFTFLALRRMYQNSPNPMGFIGTVGFGLLVSITAALGYSALSYLYTHFLIPDYAQKMALKEAEYLRLEGRGEAEIKKAMDNIVAHYTSLKPYRNTLIWYAGLGLVYSILSYAILRFLYRSRAKQQDPPAYAA